jgi:hypothetical protein
VSRAFVKEDDGDSEVVAPRPQRRHPYYVTPEGHAQLQERLAQAQAAGNAREVEDLQARLEEAIVVDPHSGFSDLSDDLVPRHDGGGMSGELFVYDVQIGPADAARANAQQQLTRARHWNRAFFKL